jgi:hypothetical protein
MPSARHSLASGEAIMAGRFSFVFMVVLLSRRIILSNFNKSLEHQWAAWQRPKS